jgi:hypothetical protein
MDTDSLRFKDQDSGEYEAAGVGPGFETWKAIIAGVSLESRNNSAKSPLEEICYPLASRQRGGVSLTFGNFDPH